MMSQSKQPEARLFFVDTNFQKMARRPGGVPRDQAIENAQSYLVEETKISFDDWLDQRLQDLKSALSEVEQGSAKTDSLDRASFHCRQLRDAGTTCGFELLTFIADSLCIVLDAIKDGAPFEPESVACHVDALTLIKQNSYRRLKPDQLPELTSGLRRVVDRLNAAAN